MARLVYAVLTVLALVVCGCSGGGTSTPVVLVAIGVAPSTAAGAPGTKVPFRANAIYSNGAALDVTNSVTWSSSDAGVATVDGSGVVSAVGPGTATISATTLGKTGSATFTTAQVTSIAISPANSTAIVGTTQQYKAVGTLSTGGTQDVTPLVTWSSSNPAVAGINASGLASALGNGQTTVSATAGSVSASTPLTVATLVSVAVTPANPVVLVGGTQQFTAIGTLSNQATKDVSGMVSWNTGNASILTVNSSGNAAAISPGTTTISASFPGIQTQTTTVTVQGPTSIVVAPANATAIVGSTLQMTATGTFSDGSSRDLTSIAAWSSDNPGVASVSNSAGSRGVVSASSNGSAVITATVGVAGSTTLAAKTLSSLVVTPANPVVPQGSTLHLTAMATFTDGSTQDLSDQATWTSSTPAIASVGDVSGSKGIVSGNTLGTSTITAKLATRTATTVVTVKQGGVIVTPVNKLYVSNFSNNTLSVIDTLTNSLITNIGVGAGPQGVALNTTTNRAYVANTNGSSVSVIDIANNLLIDTIPAGGGPWDIAVDSSANRVYVANSQSNTVTVIDGKNDTILATIPVGTSPRGIAVNSATNTAYVTNFGANNVSVINTATNTVVATIAVGQGPADAAVNQSANTVFVANSFSPTLSVINGTTNSVTATPTVGANARVIAVNPAANRAYVTLDVNNSVAVIDTLSNAVVATIPVGTAPRGVAVKPAANRLYVANNNSNNVTVLDTTSNAVVTTISGVSGPTYLAVIP